MNSPRVDLRVAARRILGRDLGDAEAEAIHNYLEILGKWQRIHRLVGSSDRGWAIRNLVLDSLLFHRVLPADLKTALDLGSGAGVPGIPLAIVRPETRFVLLEARQRRASFLAEVVRSLPLVGCRVVAERAEAVVGAMAGRFEAVVMRCAGDPDRIIPLARQFTAPGGVIVMSGPPDARPMSEGRWVEVPGVDEGSRRRFLVMIV